MSQQQQQQQQQPRKQPAALVLQLSPFTWEKQLFTLIAGLQQQVATLLQQSGRARVEIAKFLLFSGKIKEVSIFINMVQLYLSMKMIEELKLTKIAWVLSYVQEEVAEAWKDNLLDELLKGELEVKTIEELFSKMRNEFGEMAEEKRKVEQLRTIEQRCQHVAMRTQSSTKIVIQKELDRVPYQIAQLLIQISVSLCAYLLQSHDSY